MCKRAFPFGALLLLIVAILFVAPGCDKSGSPVEPENQEVFNPIPGSEQNPWIGDDPSENDKASGAWIAVAWPLKTQNPNDWTGWQGSRTSGGSGSYCGGRYSYTHSGADYMARDLNRIDGNDNGKDVFAGISGKVVQAVSPNEWNQGYGGTVVVYDHSRRVALRQTHLSEVAVSVGQNISYRTRVGKVGNSGNSSGPHLHLAAYENIDHFVNGDSARPVIPILCDSEWYTCGTYFYSWQ
jgi:murein DD-endopeptidase MepM/ murein hydrolase activator NlpD